MNIRTNSKMPHAAAEAMVSIAANAWRQGMLAGFSGNLSMRLANGLILITCSGTAKGRLTENDLAVVTVSGKIVHGTKQPSSESLLHLAIYESYPACGAILHTHPPCLQALELKLPEPEQKFLNLELYEARMWRKHLVWTPVCPPGDLMLAQASVNALRTAYGRELPAPCGVWLSRHGLCAISSDISSCLGLSEELEHLAKVQLLAL